MSWNIEAFFDGECPLCLKEVQLLRKLDRKELIRWTDIAALGFDAQVYGKTHDEFMAKMHGRLPDGTWVEGVEVFRQLYAAVGFGPLVSLSRLPGISHVADLGYQVFAKNRLRLTGRCRDEVCAIESVKAPA
jgi:predicted DCC family thiol-disulfide oxidoreductase YuxK